MTIVQLVGHFLLMTITNPLFLNMPSYWKCALRPVVVGICFTTTVSVNVAKTQKLHIIFNAKTKHRGAKRRTIGILEWLIIGLLLLVDSGILIVTLQSSDITVERHNIDEELVKEFTCSTNGQIIIQLVFILLLVLVNGIQAFRARHLPSHYKETTHVVYSSFTSALLLSVVSAIYFTQKRASIRDMIIWTSVLTLNALHFLLIYVYNMYVILVKPEENTSKHFQEKRKAKIEQNFNFF